MLADESDKSNKSSSFVFEVAGTRVTRRELLKGAGAIGAAVALGPIVGACGGTGDSVSSSPSGASSPKKGGNLRLGITGGSTKDVVDGHLSNAMPDDLRARQLFDTLLMRDHDFQIKPALATEATANATGDVWTIRLRPDVTFHDGKALTADDVIYTFKLLLDPKFPNGVANQLSSVDPKQLKKLDDFTLQVTLKQPNAIFDDVLTLSKLTIKPVDYDSKKPVGTGPFMYQTFVPGDRSVFPANPNYWGTGPYVDQVETIDFADATAQVNSLISGEVDAIGELPAAQREVVEQAGMDLVTSKTARFNYFFWRADMKPWSDVRVRQAMRLIMDRQQMIDQALFGNGQIGNDMWSWPDPAYPKDFPQRVQDLEQAKSLLKQAGYDNDLSFVLYAADSGSGMVESVQVFAEQAKGAGVTAKVQKVDTSEFLGDKFLTYPNGPIWYSGRMYLVQALVFEQWNEAHFEDPKWKALHAEAVRTVDPTKRNELVRESYQIDYDIGPWDVWSFSNLVDASSNKVAGLAPDVCGFSFNGGYVNELWMT